MADWGIKISQTGYDAKTASVNNLVFTSADSPVKILLTGTINVTIPAASTTATTTIYLPDGFNSEPVPVASAIINGKRYLTNLPSSYGTIVSPTDYHAFGASNDFATTIAPYGQVFPVYFTITRNVGGTSSTSGTDETISVRYFILDFTITFPVGALT